MIEQIRSYDALGHDEIVRLARQQADSGEPCGHGYAIGSTQACTWERAYVARQIETQQAEG